MKLNKIVLSFALLNLMFMLIDGYIREIKSYSKLDSHVISNNIYDDLLTNSIESIIKNQEEIMSNTSKLLLDLLNDKSLYKGTYFKKHAVVHKQALGHGKINNKFERSENCETENSTESCQVCRNLVRIIDLAWNHLELNTDNLLRLMCIKEKEKSEICSTFIKTVIENLLLIGRSLTTEDLLCTIISDSCLKSEFFEGGVLSCNDCQVFLQKSSEVAHRFSSLMGLLNMICPSTYCNDRVNHMINSLRMFLQTTDHATDNHKETCRIWFRCRNV
uniref:Uncharacterized protein n=1 Tax=Meloidogyne enterolobii TaxID=390850 RepID=A0A6V7VU17_MELEN|nr:unnamed protein product [Meloidogyne enterolobii]